MVKFNTNSSDNSYTNLVIFSGKFQPVFGVRFQLKKQENVINIC
jgi:hypothetical protein